MAIKKRSVLQKLNPTLLFIICLLCISFSGCDKNSPSDRYRTYHSNYTVEEHIERVDDVLEYYLRYDLNFIMPKERVSHKWITNIEILYSIGYEFPEYFIVEFKVPEGFLNDYGDSYFFSDCYLIGTIKNDKYYSLAIKVGSSPYKDIGADVQKYYSYHPDVFEYCAYKENGKYEFIHNDELNKNYPTKEKINILGNTIDTVVWRWGVAKPLLDLEISAESLGEREFNSSFTAEENLQRLTNLVKTNLKKINTAEIYEEKNIIDVQIMYSLYYERPEYFLIQFKKEKVDEEGVYNYQFIVGQIKNDNFYKIYESPLDNNLGVSPYVTNKNTVGTKKYYMPVDNYNKIGVFYYLNKDTSFITVAYWNNSNSDISEMEKNIDYVIILDKYEWVPLMVN